MSRKFFYLPVGFFIIFLLFKIIFVFYGYIATEEGTLIYNAQKAYQGNMPFADYDGWNSLTNDYVLGLFNSYINNSILNQRFIGLVFSAAIFWITIGIVARIKDPAAICITSILLATGSYTFIYLTTIPYSESTMMLFIMLGLFFLAKDLSQKSVRVLYINVAISFFLLATITRIQALPTYVLMAIYSYIQLKKKSEKFSFIFFQIILLFLFTLPFFIKNPSAFFYSFTWPLRAEKILVYQQNAFFSAGAILSYFQELGRDYGIFILLICAGLPYLFKRNNTNNHHEKLIVSLFMVTLTFIVTGLIHKPPYASYLYPAVPIMSIIGGYIFSLFWNNLHYIGKKTLAITAGLLILNNFLNYPHYKLIKTSLFDIDKTPHSYLADVSSIIVKNSAKNDEILSWYTPLTITSERKIPSNFNRDRFSLSVLPTKESRSHHLMSEEELLEIITSQEAKLIIFSDKDKQYFGSTREKRTQVEQAINTNYINIGSYKQISSIESPNRGLLYIYKKRS